jgi:hypothetical protein
MRDLVDELEWLRLLREAERELPDLTLRHRAMLPADPLRARRRRRRRILTPDLPARRAS